MAACVEVNGNSTQSSVSLYMAIAHMYIQSSGHCYSLSPININIAVFSDSYV